MTFARRASWKITAVAVLLMLSHSSAQSMMRTSVAQRGAGGEQEVVPNTFFPRAEVAQQQRQFRTAGASGSPTSPAFGRAALSVTSANALIWVFSRTLRSEEEKPGFKVGFNSWRENLQNGFEWDDNNFITNQFMHPYQGNLYFNGARANGFDFWQSAPFTFAGSLMWEYFGEVHHPSFNDYITTTFGGISLGEIFYRMSDMILDNRSSGSTRAWRELGGLIINPVRGFNRLLDGSAQRIAANPEGRFPDRIEAGFELGVRTLGNDNLWNQEDAWASLAYWLQYGDPIYQPSTKPFDAFDFEVRMDLRDSNFLNRLHVQGMLSGTSLKSTSSVQHTLAAFSNFDYDINSAYEYGDQRVGAAFLSGFRSSRGSQVRTELHADAVLLGAVKSDLQNFTGREYDYGPGLGTTLNVSYQRNHVDFFSIEVARRIIHIVNGEPATHILGFGSVKLDLPLNRLTAVGIEYTAYTADRNYRDLPSTHQAARAVRAFVSLRLGRSSEIPLYD